MAKLADARRSLQKAKQSALQRLQQLEDERNEIKSSLKSLDAALRALQGNTAKPKRKPKTATEEFSCIVDRTLHAIGPCTVAELAAAIRQRLDASGLPTHELEARLEAEVSDSRFAEDDGVFRLQANN